MFALDDLLFLRELPGVGERTLARLIEAQRARGQSLHALSTCPVDQLTERHGLPNAAVRRLAAERQRHLTRCVGLQQELRRGAGFALPSGADRYPRRLHSDEAPPPLLFGLGNLSLLDRPAVSVLVSRAIDEETMRGALAIAQAAALESWPVVCGGMKSTHRLVAMAARSSGAGRIVILDRGLFSAFGGEWHRDPFGCGPRPARLNRQRTLVLSPFRLEDHAAASHGRRRDGLIAALGSLVFVPTLQPGGETESLCRAAIARGRQVLLWRSRYRPLLRAGAHFVDAETLQRGISRFVAPPPAGGAL